MRTADRRPRIRNGAWLSRALTWREKCFIARVTEIPAEMDPETGRRRYGSKAMGHDGKYAFHLDYVAQMLGTSPAAVKKAQEGCQVKGFLSLVHPATFGRPSTHQALVVRRDEKGGLTDFQNVPPYGDEAPPTRRDETSPLTYRGGNQPDQAGHPRPSPQASGDEAPRKEPRLKSDEANVTAWRQTQTAAAVPNGNAPVNNAA